MHTRDHPLRLTLVIGHPVRIFGCSGLQYECAEDGCVWHELESLETFKRRKAERVELFCGTVIEVSRHGCTCGMATTQEIEDLRREADEAAVAGGW